MPGTITDLNAFAINRHIREAKRDRAEAARLRAEAAAIIENVTAGLTPAERAEFERLLVNA